jgi:hypothetical protein
MIFAIFIDIKKGTIGNSGPHARYSQGRIFAAPGVLKSEKSEKGKMHETNASFNGPFNRTCMFVMRPE